MSESLREISAQGLVQPLYSHSQDFLVQILPHFSFCLHFGIVHVFHEMLDSLLRGRFENEIISDRHPIVLSIVGLKRHSLAIDEHGSPLLKDLVYVELVRSNHLGA